MSQDAHQDVIAGLKEQIGMLTAQVQHAQELGKQNQEDIEALQRDVIFQQNLSKTLGDRLFLGVDDHGVPITLIQKFTELHLAINSIKGHDSSKSEDLVKTRTQPFSWINFGKGIAAIGILTSVVFTTAWRILSGETTEQEVLKEMPSSFEKRDER